MEPVSDTAAAGALLGIKPLTILGGAVGGLISLSFFDGQSTRVRWTAAVGGCGLAWLLSDSITSWAGLHPKAETVISVVVAMFGMSIVTAVARAIKDIKWADVFWAVLGKFGIKRNGGGQDGGQP